MTCCTAANCDALPLGERMAAALASVYGCDLDGLCADHAAEHFEAAARRSDAPGPASELEGVSSDGRRLRTLDDGTGDLLWLRRWGGLDLDDLDGAICDASAELACLNRAAIARRVGAHRSTVSRRVSRLRSMATLARPLTDLARWRLVAAMLRGDLHTPEKTRLARHHHGTARSVHRHKRRLPPRCPACGRYVEQPATGRPRRWCPGPRGERCRKRYVRRLARPG